MASSSPAPRKKSPLQQHKDGDCGCSVLRNPSNCLYQPFLDGWDFTPDVGNGSERGEVFTPRFIVDKMIVDSHILPRKAVYDYDYRGSQATLRKYVGTRVFEPAVGTGNFIATVLWHKLEMAHELTGYTGTPKAAHRKTAAQLRRYQAYTLVALGSVYFNDIDAGNLQTVKWRLLRDQEINTDENISFWVDHVNSALRTPLPARRLRPVIQASVKAASRNWGIADRDRGILDTLYERHTGKPAPGWLMEAWKHILDRNAKLFNAISNGDQVESSCAIPGAHDVEWTFWRFENSSTRIRAYSTTVPLAKQILEGQVREVEKQLSLIPMVEAVDATPSLFTGEVELVPDGKTAAVQHRLLTKTRQRLKEQLHALDARTTTDSRDLWSREQRPERDMTRIAV